MCEAMTEPPRPGAELFCYWRDEPIPIEGEQRDFELGDWKLLVRIVKVKDSIYKPGVKQVTMEVI